MRRPFFVVVLAVALGQVPGQAPAQEWNPFDPFATQQRKPAEPRKEPPRNSNSDDVGAPVVDRGSTTVERGDLAPVMAPDGSGLPFELWRGLDVGTLERLIAELDIPPRSPALHRLWLRLITSDVTPPDGGATNQQFLALRLETLYRSGLLEQAAAMLAKMAPGDPVVAWLAARNEIGVGDKQRGCATAQSAGTPGAALPKPLKAQAALISGYCAMTAGDAAGAGLAAELAREEGAKETAGLQALDAVSVGSKPQVTSTQPISLLDYRLVEAAGGAVDTGSFLKQAAPSLLAALAIDANTEPGLKLAAAEAAAQTNSITPEELAATYRAQSPATAVISDAAGADTPQRRAALFAAAEQEHTPQKKVRLIRSFLDEAHRAGFYLIGLRMVAPASDTIVPAPEIGWYAETGVEVALAAGSYKSARDWAIFGTTSGGGASLNHWLALIDIADGGATDRQTELHYVEDMAVNGRLDPTLLHRLATVLDALQYDVPIPLWDAASRTPQPVGGYLPETGVLSELQDAAKKREFGRTVLLAMKTLGPNGAEGAHMIALGDSIRALRRAGLEPDARNLGFEALFASWPRAISN
jgi:hypothetical protein